MKTNSTFSPDESAQESALRVTLHEHAPVDVNVDRAWSIVSQRLSTNAQPSAHSTFRTLLSWLPGKRNYPVSLKGRLIVGAVAFVAILVVGMNILFPLMPGSGSVADAKQFQPIGISQGSNGITFVAYKAYASDGGTAIEYYVQPSANLLKDLKPGFVTAIPEKYTLKYQNGELQSASGKAAQIITMAFQSSHAPVKNVIIFNALHPLADTDKLTVTWDITSIILNDTGINYRWSKVFNGHWHFQFTVSFHHGNFLPVLPAWKLSTSTTR